MYQLKNNIFNRMICRLFIAKQLQLILMKHQLLSLFLLALQRCPLINLNIWMRRKIISPVRFDSDNELDVVISPKKVSLQSKHTMKIPAL